MQDERVPYPDTPVVAPLADWALKLYRPFFDGLAQALGANALLENGHLVCRASQGEIELVQHGLRAFKRVHLVSDAFLRAAAEPHRDRLAALLQRLASGNRKQISEPSLRRLAARTGLIPGLLEVGRAAVFLFEAKSGWRTSYSFESWHEPLARIDARALPDDDEVTADLLRELASLCASPPIANARTEGTCRFCHQVFPAHTFLFNHQACHGCAVRHLGVVF